MEASFFVKQVTDAPIYAGFSLHLRLVACTYSDNVFFNCRAFITLQSVAKPWPARQFGHAMQI